MSRDVMICVTGMPGAGKTLIARRIAESFSAPLVSMGDVMREEASRRGIGLDLASMMRFAKKIREEYGAAAVSELVYRRIKSLSGVVVVDGIRSLEEINYFRERRDVVVVAVHASPRERFRRLKARGRRDDPRTWEAFMDRDLKELRIGLGNVIALADVMIVNEGAEVEELVEEAARRIREVIKDIQDGDKG